MPQKAIQNLVGKLQGWLESLIVMLPNLIGAALIVVLFWVAARLLRKLVLKLLQRISVYAQVNKLVGTMTYLLVMVTGLFFALGVLNLQKTVTSLLAGAGIIGLALGFAFQDIAANFMSGIFLSIRRPFRENDLVETNNYFGTVERITLRSTELISAQGQVVIIPNKEVFQNPIVNYSQTGRRRVDLKVGVSYGDDLQTVRDVALAALDALDGLEPGRPVDFFYEEFGSSSINFVIRFWISHTGQADYLRARSDAVMRIKHAFDAHGITIPFPIRTLDFGIVGGEKLSDVLPSGLYPAKNQQPD